MSKANKVWGVLILWSVIIFVIGFAIGDKSANQSIKKEMLELSIELTNLEIKKLKGVK